MARQGFVSWAAEKIVCKSWFIGSFTTQFSPFFMTRKSPLFIRDQIGAWGVYQA